MIENNYFLQNKKLNEETSILNNDRENEVEQKINIYFIVDGFIDDYNPVKMPVIKYSFKKKI